MIDLGSNMKFERLWSLKGATKEARETHSRNEDAHKLVVRGREWQRDVC
jgi:hypothetical protein